MEISQKYKTQEGNTRDLHKKKKVTCISYVSQKDWKIKIRNKDILNEDKCIVIKTLLPACGYVIYIFKRIIANYIFAYILEAIRDTYCLYAC